MTRPLTRVERAGQNSRTHMENQRDKFIAAHGEDLGALYFIVMLIQTIGRQAIKRGDTDKFRTLAHDLSAVYAKHTQ